MQCILACTMQSRAVGCVRAGCSCHLAPPLPIECVLVVGLQARSFSKSTAVLRWTLDAGS